MLTKYLVAGKLALQEPPSGWVERAIALDLQPVGLRAQLRRVIASLTFDSWSLPAPVGVRGLAPLTQRRIRLEADSVSLEIRAEKRARHWSFVAQATGLPASQCMLRVSNKEMNADPHGFFQWTSAIPPRSLILTAGDQVIEIPELSWKMPKP